MNMFFKYQYKAYSFVHATTWLQSKILWTLSNLGCQVSNINTFGYSYLCNQCLSPLTLWVWTPLRQVCQWLATGRWFSPSTPVFSTNKTDCHDIAEILLKVALNIKTLNPKYIWCTGKKLEFLLVYFIWLNFSLAYFVRFWKGMVELQTMIIF